MNEKGSTSSLSGSGAKIITAPNAPINLAEISSERSATTLGLSWTADNSDGGSPILDYRVSYGKSGSFLFLDPTTSTNIIIPDLTYGTTYELKIEARNEYGYSK